jgi:hypothetical protein
MVILHIGHSPGRPEMVHNGFIVANKSHFGEGTQLKSSEIFHLPADGLATHRPCRSVIKWLTKFGHENGQK